MMPDKRTAARRPRQTALREAKRKMEDRLGGRGSFLGTMIGVKQTDGASTKVIGLTVLVSEKIPDEDLSQRERVPRTVMGAGEPVVTDVLVWPTFEAQGIESIIYDGLTQGTLSCFARSNLGMFGVSSGHCLVGKDCNGATPTPVTMYKPGSSAYAAGQSLYVAMSPGAPGRFGYVDCGLFTLEAPSLVARAGLAKPAAIVGNLQTLLHKQVLAISSLDAPGWPSSDPLRRAEVIGINADALNERVDIVMRAALPGTFRGNSGMLWRTQDGRLVGLHCRGEVVPNGGSFLITAMAVSRLPKILDVTLIVE